MVQTLQGCAELAMKIFRALLVIAAFLASLVFIWIPQWNQLFSAGPGAGGGPGGGAGSSVMSAGPSASQPASLGGSFILSPSAEPSDEPPRSPQASGGSGQVPAVSARDITGGSAQVNVSGFFGVDTEIPINTVVSYAVETDTWLYYGAAGTQAANAGIALARPDTRVEITLGAYRATSEGDECTMEVDVTTTSVSGHISCTGVMALHLIDGTTGLVTIEIDFTADS